MHFQLKRALIASYMKLQFMRENSNLYSVWVKRFKYYCIFKNELWRENSNEPSLIFWHENSNETSLNILARKFIFLVAYGKMN